MIELPSQYSNGSSRHVVSEPEAMATANQQADQMDEDDLQPQTSADTQPGYD